ncbi:hypothetical protein MRX96_024911 [Rhipicephalus microplus]
MLEAELLAHQLRKWDEVDNLRYVKIVEDAISQAVTWHQRGEDGTYGRRSSNTRLKVQDVFAPPHLYGQMVQHKEGLEYLQKHGSLEHHFETVMAGDMSNEEALLRLKASLWTVGHVGTSPEGFALVADADVLSSVVRMAQESPIYSIRGVCFYVLCLLASTGDSVEYLSGLGWDCVQHKHNEVWPVASDALRAVKTSPAPLRAHTWSISSAGSQQSEMLTASALHRRFHGSAASSLSCVDAGETPQRRTLNFVSEQAKSQAESSNSGVRHSQTLPRNVTLSPRHDALVASSRRPRSSSDCRPGDARHDADGETTQRQVYKSPEAVAVHPSVAECRLLSVPDSSKDRSSSFGGSRDSGTETSFTEKSSSNAEVKGERSDSNESAITTGKSRSDSCTDSTTSGVSSCDENAATARTVQTLSPIASSTSLSTLGGNRGDGAVMPRRPRGFIGGVRTLTRSSTATSPLSPDSPVLMYTSARDVAGYATLRAVREASSMRRRRKRVCSVGCDGTEPHGELFSPPSFAGWSLDRSGFYIGEEPYPDDTTSIRTMSMSSTASAATARSSAGRTDERFMGLCVPVDTALIFSVYDHVQPSTGGSGEDKLSEGTESVEERSDGFELHTTRECLLCHSIERVAKMKERLAGSPEKSVSPVGAVSPTIEEHCSVDVREAVIGAFAFSRSSQTRRNRKSGDRSAVEMDYDPISVRREMLKYIANLNSSVIMKGSEQALLTLKQKYPSAFQDVCLYSEVCLLMSRYRYRLGARTLLQELFFDLSLEKQFFEEAECILRIPHVVVMPPKEESEA